MSVACQSWLLSGTHQGSLVLNLLADFLLLVWALHFHSFVCAVAFVWGDFALCTGSCFLLFSSSVKSSVLLSRFCRGASILSSPTFCTCCSVVYDWPVYMSVFYKSGDLFPELAYDCLKIVNLYDYIQSKMFSLWVNMLVEFLAKRVDWLWNSGPV